MHEEAATIRFSLAPEGHLAPFRAAVSERSGGVSHGPFASLNVGRSGTDRPQRVAANERRVLDALGLPDHVARLQLEHGARIATAAAPGCLGPADALLTRDPDLVLWFTVADCFPVTLTDGVARAHGHCGWRGVAAGLPEAMALALLGGGAAAPLRAWIGPGIGPCCYAVGPEVARRFAASSVRRGNDGSLRLDLRSEIRRRLREAGLEAGGIAESGGCTACDPDRFFSHRRDGSPAGRHAALCWRDRSDHRSPSSSR